jgi:hypothetical protein
MLLRNNLWLYIQLIFCTISILACLIVLPKIYDEINQLHDYVIESIQEFKSDVDEAWIVLMDIQTYGVNRAKRSESYESPSEECAPGPAG